MPAVDGLALTSRAHLHTGDSVALREDREERKKKKRERETKQQQQQQKETNGLYCLRMLATDMLRS